MAEVIVSHIAEIRESRITDPALSEKLPDIRFADGTTASLELSNPKAHALMGLLKSLHYDGLPAYVTLSDDKKIADVRVPIQKRVVNLKENAEGDLDVELEISHAVHTLKRSHPDFATLERKLSDAIRSQSEVLITEDIDNSILSVDPALSPFDVRPAAPQILSPLPLAAAGPITEQKARELFNSVADLSCDPLRITDICIPFRYPRDGCWARAHEMYRRLSAQAMIGNLWLYGDLNVRTANDPTCSVSWRYHVAPTVQVQGGSGFRTFILDPSLFAAPVTDAEWIRKQTSAGNAVATEGKVYYRAPNGNLIFDDTFSATATDLKTYRAQLLKMTVDNGPPPYARCAAVS